MHCILRSVSLLFLSFFSLNCFGLKNNNNIEEKIKKPFINAQLVRDCAEDFLRAAILSSLFTGMYAFVDSRTGQNLHWDISDYARLAWFLTCFTSGAHIGHNLAQAYKEANGDAQQY